MIKIPPRSKGKKTIVVKKAKVKKISIKFPLKKRGGYTIQNARVNWDKMRLELTYVKPGVVKTK